ncbi:VWA domain-containing protein [Streptomyces sp. R21]|uniref:VWA domain-containing protein n=1 Tax=Streptomyces sp. R21 TaxID=3238627 RepID=A0AB39P867_9ACTN
MGILSLLRNAFGRSNKGRDAEAETALEAPAPTVPAPATEPVPSQEAGPRIPSPSPEPEPEPAAGVAPESSSSVVDELVSAAFDNVTVPKPAVSSETERAAEAEPAAAADAEVEVEAPVAVEPEPVVEPVAAAAEPVVEPEPETEPETEPVVEPEAVVEVAEEVAPLAEDTTPVAEDVVPVPEEVTPVAEDAEDVVPVLEEVVETPEPAAVADVAEPPQGPPAADDESRTGGAGGNITAEGEAEAVAVAEPEGEAEAVSDAEGEAEAGSTPAPANPLPTVKSKAPALATAYKEAGTALGKRDLTGTRAKVYLVLDRSASMRPYYKDGSAQALGEQTLALAAHLDPEATVHVVFFSTELDGTGELTLAEHENKIDDLHAGLGRMGRTSYHAAVQEVLTQHEKSDDPMAPALVIFQTDGAPDAKTPATQSLTDAAKNHPAVFFSFVAFGEPENKAFDYLRKLKTDNTSFFHAGPTPRELTDAELYDGVLATWRP